MASDRAFGITAEANGADRLLRAAVDNNGIRVAGQSDLKFGVTVAEFHQLTSYGGHSF